MLVISRKANETIRIGEDVTVEIRRIAGNRVTVAIKAPRDVRILRGELEVAATEFEDAAAPESVEPTLPVERTRIRVPRIHNPYRQGQAVG